MPVSAHFDGRVFVPDGPVDLPVGRRVRVVPEPVDIGTVSADVNNFCLAHGIGDQVAELRQLVRGSISSLVATELRMDLDPDSGDSWLVVEAVVKDGNVGVLSEYDAVLRRWIATTEPRVRDLIRLTISLA